MKCENITKLVMKGVAAKKGDYFCQGHMLVTVEVLETRIDHFDDCPEDEITAFDALTLSYNLKAQRITPGGLPSGVDKLTRFIEDDYFDMFDDTTLFAVQLFDYAMRIAGWKGWKLDKISRIEIKEEIPDACKNCSMCTV